MSKIDTYIVSWDCYGLETIFNATELEQERIMNILGDREVSKNESVGQILTRLTLRARFNTQRHYEIYAIDVVDGISKDDIILAFSQSPQTMADLIRKQGTQLYSDRNDQSRVKIV